MGTCLWVGKVRACASVLLGLPKSWTTCSFCMSGLQHAGSLAQVADGWGCAQPAALLPNLGASCQVGLHALASGSSKTAVTCCPGCNSSAQQSCSPSPSSGILLWAQRLLGHVPSGHSICALNAKEAPVGSVPKPTLPPQIPQCLSPPSKDKKTEGSWPAVPSLPHREQGRGGTEDNGGLSWH